METYRGVVYPAQSDAMGHMTVQYYVAAFDQAMWHLIHSLGYEPAWRFERNEGWADVRYEIDFRGELRVGDLFTVESEVISVGSSSLKSHHRMVNVDGNLAAEISMVSVYFDLQARKSKQLPPVVRDSAQRLVARGTSGVQS